ncbi:uncharacterized protein ACO6RY_18034 [Pungitius sinensis]
MNGILFVLYCVEILGPVLCGAQTSSYPVTSTGNQNPNSSPPASITPPTTHPNSTNPSLSQDSNNHSASPSSGQQTTIASTTPTTPTTPLLSIYSKQCRPVVIVAGGLIIACAILLISTLLLVCKVCQLSIQVKMLSDNADLISTTEYWMGTAKKRKSVSETEAKETTVLMVDIVQTEEDVGEGATKGEGGKENKDGQREEEKEEVKEEVAKTEPSAEPETAAEDASSSKSPEEATDLQSVKTGAAPTSGCNEEPKEKA